MKDAFLAACIGVVLGCTFVLAQKTHTMSINKVDPLEEDNQWMQARNLWITKKSKAVKVLSWNGTLKQDITKEVICKIILMQQKNGKYMPTTIDSEKPCCQSIEEYNFVWPCLKKFSNFPDKCPIPAGEYVVNSLDPNECDVPLFLPPGSPEQYKLVFSGKHKNKPIFKMTGYASAKKKMLF